MNIHHRLAAVWLIFFCGAAATLDGSDALRMQLSPSVTRAPALLTVRITLSAAADNRVLKVVAESPDFYRSSEIQLDGANTPPTSVFEFRNLPTGLYQVTGVLIGASGERAKVSRLARVEPTFGSGR
jgi:hypothetical protein